MGQITDKELLQEEFDPQLIMASPYTALEIPGDVGEWKTSTEIDVDAGAGAGGGGGG